MSVTSWFLVSSGGTRHRLPREMIFVGRDDCELMLQSRSVDKQHAVINYEPGSDEHKVKDLGSLNGTFVNDVRIQEQMYITLNLEDKLRFGYDTNWFTVERGELTVPEEALKHEKFTSGLQLSKKPTAKGETTSKSPVKTPSKTQKSSPSGGAPRPGQKTTDGVSPSREPTLKSGDTHKAEEKIGGDGAALPRGTPLYGQPAWWGYGDTDEKNSFKLDTKISGRKHDLTEGKEARRGEPTKEDGQNLSYMEMPTKENHLATNGIHEIPTKDTEGSASQGSTAQGHASFTIEFDNTSPGKVTIKDHVSRFMPGQHRSRAKRSGAGSGGSGDRDLSTLQAAMMASESKVADWLAQNDPTLIRGESTEEDSKSNKSDVPVHLKRLKGKGPAPISATVAAGAPTAARVLLKQRSEDPSIGRSSISTGLATGSPSSPSEDVSIAGPGPGAGAGDEHSDNGTYTIELENTNLEEEEEARRMIDKVFGLQQNQASCISDLPGEGQEKETKETGKEAPPADSSWVSQWASLAATHTRTDPEGSGAETAAFVDKERGADALVSSTSQSSSSLTERKRRTLPPLPVDDPRTKTSAVKAAPLRSEIGEKQDTEPQEKQHKGDGESPPPPMENGDTTSKHKSSANASPCKTPQRNSSSAERRKRSEKRKEEGEGEGGEKSGKPLVRQGSFTIEKPSGNVAPELIPHINRGSAGTRERSDSVGSMDTATLLKDTEAVMAFLEAKLRDENKLEQKASKTSSVSSQVSGYGYPPRADSISPESDVDTASTASHVAGEAEGKAGGMQKRRSLSSMHREKSNMSTASKSSVSASARDRLERKTKSRTTEATSRTETRRSVQPSSSRARQPSVDLTDDDQTSSFPISDILSSDQETYSGSAYGYDSRAAKTATSSKSSRTLQATTTSSQSKQAALPKPRPTRAYLLRRARLGDTSDTDLADADRVSIASEVSTTSSTSRPPSGRGGLSRLDMLAQPRRNRLGSISARSDSECTVSRSSAASPRPSSETALRLGLRSSTPTENKLTPRMRANSVSKLNEARTKTTTTGYCSPTESSQPEPGGAETDEELLGTVPALQNLRRVSSSNRWRRVPPEYASTSEEEFSSSRISSKQGGRPHTRPHHLVPARGSKPTSTTASQGTGALPGVGGVVLKHRMKEQDEYIRDWTAHSEEIARLFPCVRRISQDLAKDLATLAREIHDVAGKIDSVSSSDTAPSTTVSTAATTPGSAIDTREEVGPGRPTQPDLQASMRKLVDRVFDESLKFRKAPPIISTTKMPEINGKPTELRPRPPDGHDSRALRRRTWNREDAVLDSLLLHSVSQLSTKIRLSTDKTAGKIRILFKDEDRNWEDIESKMKSESDVPLLKTSNKEISSVLLELRKVEKQLEVINLMLDPEGKLDTLASPSTPTKPAISKPVPPSTSSPQQLQTKQLLPEIFPATGGSTESARVPPTCSASSTDVTIGLGLSSVGGLPFSRMRPSGKEALAQK
nr:centrosomal protein of 170 kDa-like isoform X3 [Nerophis lumbriciformis]